MSYNTSVFKLPEFKFDVWNNLPPTYQNKNHCVVIGERKFHLNKSKSKFISVGLAQDFNFEPYVKLCGNKCDSIIFKEREWMNFLTYKDVIVNYFYNNNTTEPIQTEEFRIDFEELYGTRVIKILKNNSYICLGYESIYKIWEYDVIIKYRLDMLKKLQFNNYFKIVRKGLKTQVGNIRENAMNLLHPSENPNSENVGMILELIYIYPDEFEAAVIQA